MAIRPGLACVAPLWGEGTAIYGLYRCAAVKGVVFKQFTLGQGI